MQQPAADETDVPKSDAGAMADVKQLGMGAAIASLGYVFWVVGGMEMIERLAYYGVAAVRTLYGTAPRSAGGLGLTPATFGWIVMVWSFTQSIVPVFTGGLSDRYGYKETIFVSTVVKIVGYLIMGWLATFWGFMLGAVVLATGTAIFKPGIQGTLANVSSRKNSSVAWGIFYQTVNIGGFMGPLVAGFMRKMQWRYVFFACAAIICLNFLMLLTYREPNKAERLERARLRKEGKVAQKSLWRESLHELAKPHVWLYLAIFSGFWFMFNSLFDVLPNHIQDWVDTRGVVNSLFGDGGPKSSLVRFFVVMSKDGHEILPEGMLNLNAGLIMTTCFAFAALSAKIPALMSMLVGTALSTLALVLSGYSTLGFLSVGAILVFSVGEMLSSPKFSEYIGNFAPADKKAMYLGFSQIPLAIGWSLESFIGLRLYDVYGSKERFAREALAQRGMAGDLIGQIPQGEAFQRLVDLSGQDKWLVTSQLYHAHNPGIVWYIMGVIGVASAVGIYLYSRWVKGATRRGAAA